MDKLDRLTQRNAGGISRVCHHYEPEERLCYGCVKRAQCNAAIFERLAAYEDTGLNPEELKSLIPVPFGTRVYAIVQCGCYPQYAERCQTRQEAKTDNRMKAVAIHCLRKDCIRTNCAKIFERPFAISHIGKVGKSVFLTVEDAVASLKKEG